MISQEEAFLAFDRAIADTAPPALAADVPQVLFICGAPRSGTTLLYQCLSHGGQVGCISNLIARFAQNPVLGVRLSQALALPKLFSGRSDYGRTADLSEPHEFGRGWLRLLGQSDLAEPAERLPLGPKASQNIAQIAQALEMPLVVKSFSYLYFLPELAAALPNSLWLHLRRDEAQNAASLTRLYEVRGTVGDRFAWQSAVLRETIARAGDLPLNDRCLAQVQDINRRIDTDLNALPPCRRLTVDFEALRDAPRQTTEDVLSHFGLPFDHAHLPDIPK